jgi:hypothetical protein
MKAEPYTLNPLQVPARSRGDPAENMIRVERDDRESYEPGEYWGRDRTAQAATIVATGVN